MNGKKHSIMINGGLYDDIVSYCCVNSINKNDFINELLRESFMKIKYGDKPLIKKEKEKELFTKEENFQNNFENMIFEEKTEVIDKPKKRKLN